MVYRKLDSQLRQVVRRQQLQPSGKMSLTRVIIQYRNKVGHRHVNHLARIAGTQHTRSLKKLHTIRSVAVTLPIRCLHALGNHPDVKRISVDRKRRINLNVATPVIGAAAAKRSGLTGSGVTIAILDTGIYPHPDLTKPNNRIAAFRDFINNRTKPYDDNGHGTHCAGDAAGNGLSSNGRFAGPAPKAKLVGVKVLNNNGEGYDSTIIRGIEWCVNNRKTYGIRILSLSLGEKATVSWDKDPLCRALDHAWKQGLLVVASAGNAGPKQHTIESPGILPNAITVGAGDDHGSVKLTRQTVAGFSSRGPALGGGSKPDLLAPGVNVISLRAPGSSLDMLAPGSRVGSLYFTMSGTSMATPMVAGAAAQLLQRYPGLKPSQVKNLLKRKAFSLKLKVYSQGSGMTNVRFLTSAAGKAK